MNCRVLSPDPWEARPQPRAGLVDLTMATPKTCFPSFKVWDQVRSETEEVPIQCFPPEIMHRRPGWQTASPLDCMTLGKSFLLRLRFLIVKCAK